MENGGNNLINTFFLFFFFSKRGWGKNFFTDFFRGFFFFLFSGRNKSATLWKFRSYVLSRRTEQGKGRYNVGIWREAMMSAFKKEAQKSKWKKKKWGHK